MVDRPIEFYGIESDELPTFAELGNGRYIPMQDAPAASRAKVSAFLAQLRGMLDEDVIAFETAVVYVANKIEGRNADHADEFDTDD